MIKFTNLAALLALGGLAVLPACSSSGSGNHASYAAPQTPALSQGTIAQVQTRLQQAGDYNGAIDGLWGPATEAGVSSYQRQHSLKPSGQLDGDTLAMLNLSGTGQAAANTQPTGDTSPTAVNTAASNATQPTATTKP